MSEPGFASLGPTLLARKGGAKPAMRPQLPPLVQDEAELAALADEQLEDLGWNDMGGDEHDHPGSLGGADGGADVVPINAAVAADGATASVSPIVRRQQRSLEQRVLADAVMTGTESGESGESEDDYDDETDAAVYAVDYGDHAADEEDFEDEDFADEQGAEQDFALQVAAVAPVLAPARTPAPMLAPAPVVPRALAAKPQRRAAFTLRLDAERHLKLRLAATMQGVSAQVLVTEALDALLAEFDDLDLIAAHLKRH